MDTKLSSKDLHLKEELLARGIIPPKTIKKVLQIREQILEEHLEALEGLFCYIRPGTHLLCIDDLADDDCLLELNLRPQATATAGTPWAKNCLLVESEEGKIHGQWPLDSKQPLGLVIAEDYTYLYPHPAEQSQLALSAHFISPHCAKGPEAAAYDMHVTPKGDLLFVCDRWEGRITVVSLITTQVLGQVQVRDPGCPKAINLAIDASGQQAYITDNLSSSFKLLNVANMDLTAFQTDLGVLGNLVLAPDPQFIYLITLEPDFSLKYMDTDTLSVIKELDIKGEPLSRQENCPIDPLQITPDQSLLLLMTELTAPVSKPIVNVIRTRNVRTIRRYALPTKGGLGLLMGAHPNPLNAEAYSLEKLLEERGLINPQILAQISPTPDAPPAALETTEDDTEKVNYFELLDHLSPQNLIDEPAPPIGLAQESEQVIVDILVEACYQEFSIKLKEFPDEMQSLRQLALELRQELENSFAVQAELQIMGQYDLKVPIFREGLIQRLKQYPEAPSRLFTPSNLCPLCQDRLNLEKLCRQCGFSAATKAPVFQEAFDLLPAGQTLLCIPEQARLLKLNEFQEPIEEIPTHAAGIQRPVHVLQLPEQHYLISDSQGKVVEINSQGELVWEAAVTLKKPVCTYVLNTPEGYRYLIVDQGNHQIIEIDRQGAICRCVGDQVEAIRLRFPSDIHQTQKNTWLIADSGTPRVIEVDENGRIILELDRKQGLKKPVFVRRLPKQETLVVDAMRQEILFFSSRGNLMEGVSFPYWPDEAPEEFHKQPAPDHVYCLPRGELLMVGFRAWMQVQPQRKKIRWIHPLPGRRAVQQQAEMLSLEQRKASRYIELLKRVSFLKDVPENLLEKLALALNVRQIKPKSTIMKEGEMGRSMFFVIEGQLDVFKVPSKTPIASLSEGDIVGEMALILSEARSATVTTKSACILLELERDDFRTVVQSYPLLSRKLKDIAQQRKLLTKNYKNSKQQDMMKQVRAKMALKKLQELGVFPDGDPGFYETLGGMVRSVAFMPKSTICEAGESGDALYFISRGKVKVMGPSGDEPIAVLGEGQIIGEMALILNQPRSATLVAEGYCQLFELDRKAFEHVMGQYPKFHAQLQEMAEARQAELNSSPDDEIRPESAPVFEAPLLLPRVDIWTPNGTPTQPCQYYLSTLEEMLLGIGANGDIEWHFGQGSEHRFFQPYRATCLAQSILIADAGNDRILEVGLESQAVIQEWGDHQLHLKTPRSAYRTPEGFMVIADEGNHRLLVVDDKNQILWEYKAPEEIMGPHYAEMLPTGNILFADADLHFVREINHQGEVIWSYGQTMVSGDGPGELCEPRFAHRLPNGQTLIADTGNQRVILTDAQGQLLADWRGNDEYPLIEPFHCERLEDGDIIVHSASAENIMRLDIQGDVVWVGTLLPA